MGCQTCLAQGRVNATIGDILLKERLKKPPRRVNRRRIARFEGKVNRDRLAALEEELAQLRREFEDFRRRFE